MPVDESLLGRSFPPTDPYVVTAQAVGEFAQATGTPWQEGDPAPATFAIVVAFAAMSGLMLDASVGIELSRVVHGDQHFEHDRPIVVGDELIARLTVETLRQRGGADFIGTLTTVTDSTGQRVCAARATLVHRGAAA